MSSSITPAQGADLLDRVRQSVATRIVGQEATVADTLVAFLARGHVLVEGVPGTAKTLLVRSLSAALGLRFARIQFTPDLMPSDVTGVNVLRDPARGFEFQFGPVFTDLLLGDEINRAPAKTQAAKQRCGNRARRPHPLVRVRKRVHLLERIAPLDALDLLRRNWTRRDREQKDERREHRNRQSASQRVIHEKLGRHAKDAGTRAKPLVVFVEHERGARSGPARSQPFEHTHRDHIGAPCAVPQHVVAKQVRISDDDDPSLPERKAHRGIARMWHSELFTVERREDETLRRRTVQPAEAEQMNRGIGPQRWSHLPSPNALGARGVGQRENSSTREVRHAE